MMKVKGFLMVDVGDVIRDYQVIEHIGRGGMADVWSARDGKLSRMVAVKTIGHGLSSESDPVDMFKQEAKTIANLEHPHILPIYDFGEHHGSLYIVMRYVSGGSLSGWMERGLTTDEVLRVCRNMADALDYAHSRNVVHLDLKPQNILLDGHNSPYLADFGLAAALDPTGRAINPGSGTLMYMAPEQLTSDTLDKRADIYSFAVMIYHMLNGRLPFDGASPLVMKQLQFQTELPAIQSMPEGVTQALRRSVSINPNDRHQTARALIDEIEEAFGKVGVAARAEAVDAALVGIPTDLVESVTLYGRARATWDMGNGRFLLGVTHFMVMESTYANAQKHGLDLDQAGYQMILRGALEYGINADYWWAQLDDANRRWVCLHTLRSPSAPARVRALLYIETLPDEEPPRIPRTVAQALQTETDATAKLTALRVLSTRAAIRKDTKVLELKTEYIGRMLNTLAHVELKTREVQDWSPTVYGPEIDLLIAELALDNVQPTIAEAAARTVGDIRSEAAVNYLTEQQHKGREGALRALAIVRDQAGSLPKVVSWQSHFYAWIANTSIRLRSEPLHITWRFLFAMIGAWIARGVVMWVTFPLSFGMFESDKIGNTLGIGLMFGVMVGIVVLLSGELPARMHGFWSWPLRFGLSLALGWGWGTLTWGLEHYVWLRRSGDIDWSLMAFGGFGLALGLVMSSVLRLRAWMAVLMTAATISLTLYAAYNNYCAIYTTYCLPAPPFSIGPVAGIGLVFGLIFGFVIRAQSDQIEPLARVKMPEWGWGVAGGMLGVVWALFVPTLYSLGISLGRLDWLGVIGFIGYGLVIGALATYFLRGAGRIAFAVMALVAFVAVIAPINGTLMTDGPFATFNNANFPVDSLFFPNYLDYQGVTVYDSTILFTLFPLFGLILAIGGHAQLIAAELRDWLISRRKARAIATPTLRTEFLNRPPAYMPDTATLMQAVDKARAELLAGGHLDENMLTVKPDRTEVLGILNARAAAVDLNVATGKISDIMGNTEIRRRQDEDQ